MTIINISIKQTASTGLVPAKGTITFTPRRHIDADKNVITRSPFSVTLSEQGTATVELPATAGLFVWHVVELPGTAAAYDRYVEVPDSETPVDYADLVDVNPVSFQPKPAAGSPIVGWMLATSHEQAEVLSAAYPEKLIVYFTDATVSRAREIMEGLESLAASASTDASVVAAVKARVRSDAATVEGLQVTAGRVAQAASDAADGIQTAAASAAATIQAEVRGVQDKAQQAADSIRKAQDDAKQDTGVHDGDGTATGGPADTAGASGEE